MTVESAAAGKVTLYECQKFPETWIKKKDILENIQFYDPTLYHHEGLWYLFGNIKPWEGNSANQYLAIYYSEDLLNGTWKPHRDQPRLAGADHDRVQPWSLAVRRSSIAAVVRFPIALSVPRTAILRARHRIDAAGEHAQVRFRRGRRTSMMPTSVRRRRGDELRILVRGTRAVR